MNSVASYLLVYLAGILSGAAGSYLSARFTDQRRAQEARGAKSEQFKATEREMPKLFAELRTDLLAKENEFVREAFLLPNRNVTLAAGSPCLVYHETDHPHLRAQFGILKDHGYVVEVTPGIAPCFRLGEEFVEMLRSS